MLFSTIKLSLYWSQPFSAVKKEMFSQRNRTKSRKKKKKTYHMYNYGNAGVEWKLLPLFLIILNCIGKGVSILAKLPQHRFQYNIILNVLSDHVIVIHHSLDRISLTLNNMPPICSQGAAWVCSKNGWPTRFSDVPWLYYWHG